MKGISNATNATIMAQAVAVAAPYAPLASKLAAHAVAESQAVSLVSKERTSTWDLMKSAIGIARDNGHTHEVMRAGLEIACVQANVPSGSFRGYMSTVENLAGDLQAGNLTIAQVNSISVADARKRYAPGLSDVQQATKRLLEAIKGRKADGDTPAVKAWTAEQINALAQLAEDDNAKAAADAEAPEAEATVPARHVRAA